MRFSSIARSSAAAAAFVLAALSTAAVAHGPDGDGHRHERGVRNAHPDVLPPQVRDLWLDECERDRDRRYCIDYLDAYYAAGPAYPGYGHGYAVPMMMVPATAEPQQRCVETVTTEYVDTPARRVIRPAAPRRDKRIRITPDKRVPLN